MPIFIHEDRRGTLPEPPPLVAGLAPGQYELDGYRFGAATDPVWIVAGGDIRTPGEFRTQDQPNPRGETIWAGRDYRTPGTREFHLYLEAPRGGDVRPALARLDQAWNPAYRQQPGRWGVLRWRLGDTVYRSDVRPRGLQVTPPTVTNITRRAVVATLQERDAVVFLDEERGITLTLVDIVASTGLVFPARFPWNFGQATQAQRSSIAEVSSTVAVPFRVVVRGPQIGSATALRMWSDGWMLDFGQLVLRAGQTLIVDTQTQTASVDGQSVSGYLQRGSTLSGLLPPGRTEFRFTATDSSSTTTASVYWRDAATI